MRGCRCLVNASSRLLRLVWDSIVPKNEYTYNALLPERLKHTPHLIAPIQPVGTRSYEQSGDTLEKQVRRIMVLEVG